MKNKKITQAEIIFGILFTLWIDIISALIDVTGVGLAIAPILQSGATFGMIMFFRSKGDKTSKKIGNQIAKYASSALPIIPTTLAIFLISVYIHNNPKLAEKTNINPGGLKSKLRKV